LKIQKLFQTYERYLDTRKRGLLCTIHTLIKDDEIRDWMNIHAKNGRDLDEKMYLIYYNINAIEICPYCLKAKKFTLKKGYEIDGMAHRKCKKFPYNHIFKSYQEFYAIQEFKKTTYKLFVQKSEIPNLIEQWKHDHPLFQNYNESYILPLFSYVKNEDDLNDIPVCQICNKFKCSINYDLFLKNKHVYFNDYCFDCSEIVRGGGLKKSAQRLHGVDNFSQLEEVKKKKSNTCFKNYQVSNPMKSGVIKQRHVDVCKEKYGVSNVSQIDEVKKRKENTVIEHYDSWQNFVDMTLGEFCRFIGIDNVSQLESVKEKKIQTFLKNYGVENIFATEKFKEYLKQHNLEKYGVEYWSQSSEGRRFLRERMILQIEEQFKSNEPIFPVVGKYERDFLNQLSTKLPYNILRNPQCIGYFVDGFIAEKNIVIEFDEEHHFDKSGNLINKDIIRQHDIEKYLKCLFIRIKKTNWLRSKETIISECISKISNYNNRKNVNVKFVNNKYYIARQDES